MKRYTIYAREAQAGAQDIPLCECGTNPEWLVDAAKAKTLWVDNGRRRVKSPRYAHVYFVDNQAKPKGKAHETAEARVAKRQQGSGPNA